MTITLTITAADGATSQIVLPAPVINAASVPVVTPASFTLPTNPPATGIVGSIQATNSPTSFAIVSGNPSNYFAIGQHHATVVGPVPPDGIYNLSVTASNAAGTSAAVPVTVTVGKAITLTPVTFSPQMPLKAGQVVGKAAASGGTPTAWAITAGDPNRFYAIDNNGVITVTANGVALITATTYNLTLQATNAFGSVNAVWKVSPLSVPNPSDPWITLDGRLNAPVGATIQNSTLLNGYPLASPPNARIRWPILTGTQPQWEVAGVDYAVGIPAGTTLLDPTTATLPSGATYTPSSPFNFIQIAAGSGTLAFNALDFGLHNGVPISVSNSFNGTLQFNNCNFKNGTNSVRAVNFIGNFGNTNTCNIELNNCIIDMGSNNKSVTAIRLAGSSGNGPFDSSGNYIGYASRFIATSGQGHTQTKYCAWLNGCGRFVSHISSGNFTSTYDYYAGVNGDSNDHGEIMGYDPFLIGGTGTGQLVQYSFCTFTEPDFSPSGPFVCGSSGMTAFLFPNPGTTTSGLLITCEIDHCTAIATICHLQGSVSGSTLTIDNVPGAWFEMAGFAAGLSKVFGPGLPAVGAVLVSQLSGNTFQAGIGTWQLDASYPTIPDGSTAIYYKPFGHCMVDYQHLNITNVIHNTNYTDNTGAAANPYNNDGLGGTLTNVTFTGCVDMTNGAAITHF